MRIVAVFGVVVFLLALAYAPSSAATTHDVSIKDFAFQPGNLSISVGDTVTWTNNDSFTSHTTTSDTKVWDSGALDNGQSFSHTFNEAGTYTYMCTIHTSMRGTITVSEGTLPTSTAQAPTNTPLPTANPTQVPTNTPVQQPYTIDLPLMIN
jgi:plastocyanin